MSSRCPHTRPARLRRWIALSTGLHVLVAAAGYIVLRTWPYERSKATLPLELVDQAELTFPALRQVVRAPLNRAAWAEPQRRVRFGATLSTTPARPPGAPEQDRPRPAARPAREAVVGAVRDQLRSRLMNHRSLERPLASSAPQQDQQPPRPRTASKEPTLFLGLRSTDRARSSAEGQHYGAGRGAGAGRQGSAGEKRGSPLWLTTRDARYLSYFRAIYNKVNSLWNFPKRLEVLLEQGEVIIGFTIQADGSVSGIHVQKPSGFKQFDRNVVEAIEKAAPFAPVPDGLDAPLIVLAPFEFANPMVR